MKKILSIFTAMIVPISSTIAASNSINETKLISSNNNKMINYVEKFSNKQSISDFRFAPVIITDFTGVDEETILDEVLAIAMENNPDYEDFILHIFENPEMYKITGNNFKIPEENKSDSYDVRFIALSGNNNYKGLTKIKVTLTNKKIINIEQYNKLFSDEIKQLSIEAIGHSNNTKFWEKAMLAELDKQLIEHNANMYGFDGKDGNETLFSYAFDKDLIEIEFCKAFSNNFWEKYENIKIKVKPTPNNDYDLLQPNKVLNIKANVTVQNPIDISDASFINYFQNTIVFSVRFDDDYDDWKKEVFLQVDKRLENLLMKLGKPNLFTKNIEQLKIKYWNKNLWDGDYELYDLEITTPGFIQDGLLENKKLNLVAKVDRRYSFIKETMSYKYNWWISAKMSHYIERSDEKHFVVYNVKDKFKNLQNFQKKYKKIELNFRGNYKSDWPISGSFGETGQYIYFTKDLKDEISSSWIDIVNVYKDWAASYVLVQVSYKVYFQNNEVKVAVRLWQKIKIDGFISYYVELYFLMLSAVIWANY